MCDTCVSSSDRSHFTQKLNGTCSKSDQSLVVSDAARSILSTRISPSWIYFLHSPIFVACWPHGFYDYAVSHRTISVWKWNHRLMSVTNYPAYTHLFVIWIKKIPYNYSSDSRKDAKDQSWLSNFVLYRCQM